jgi:RNA polymerase sigma factor (sigma-70 family)
MAKLTALSGGRSAAERFEALIEPHFAALYRTAYRLSRSVHDAEDLVQEVCVRAFPRLAELERIDYVGHWLYCVMYRVFIDSRRRYEQKHVRALEGAEAQRLQSDAASPEEEAERAFAGRRLGRAWVKIAEEQRVLLVLHDVEGYSLSQLMAITGLKEGTLKSKLHRARVKLGRLLRREQMAETAAGAVEHEMRRRG